MLREQNLKVILVLGIKNTRGRAWGQLSPAFLLKHRKLPEAAQLIDRELLPRSGGAGSKQREMLLAFTMVLPVEGEMALISSAAWGNGALGSFLWLCTPALQQLKAAVAVLSAHVPNLPTGSGAAVRKNT